MARLSVQDEYQSGDNVTATNLNNLVNQANFVSGAGETTDDSTLEVHSSGYLKVKNNGVGDEHLQQMTDAQVTAAGNENGRSVTTNHIRNDAVTYDKMQNVAAFSVIGNNTNTPANPTSVAFDDLFDDATAHNATPVNGLNTTGGTDGLMSADDKTKLNGLAAGTGLKLTGATFSLDDTAPTSALTSAPSGKTGGAMIAYRDVANSSGGGLSTSNRVAAGWFHYGDAQIEFDPTIFFDVHGDNVPATANWAVMQVVMTTTALGPDGQAHNNSIYDLNVGILGPPNQSSTYTNKNCARSSEDSLNSINAGTLQSTVGFTSGVGTWQSVNNANYSFKGTHLLASMNAFGTGGIADSRQFIVPIHHNGNRRSVQLYVDFANYGTGVNGAVHAHECSGYVVFFIGYLL